MKRNMRELKRMTDSNIELRGEINRLIKKEKELSKELLQLHHDIESTTHIIWLTVNKLGGEFQYTELELMKVKKDGGKLQVKKLDDKVGIILKAIEGEKNDTKRESK